MSLPEQYSLSTTPKNEFRCDVYVYAHMFACAWAHVCLMSAFLVFPQLFSALSFKTGLLTESRAHWFARLAGQWAALGSFFSCYQCWDCK